MTTLIYRRAQSAKHLLPVLLLTVVLPAAQAVADTVFPNFNDTTGLTLLGDAASVGGVLRITAAAEGQLGAFWLNEPVSVSGGFTTTFQFRISDLDDTFDGADGFAFVIQNLGTAALGSGGDGLGYHEMPESLAIEFDTFAAFNDDPNDNHISIHTAGLNPNSVDESFSLGSTGTGLVPLLKDGEIHQATIIYGMGMLDVFLDDPNIPVLAIPLDLESVLGLFNGTAYFGFTSATGSGFENHDILNWSVTVVPEPSTVWLAVVAGSCLGMQFARRGRQLRRGNE